MAFSVRQTSSPSFIREMRPIESAAPPKTSLERLQTLSNTYVDDTGRRIQLWYDRKHGLVGTVVSPKNGMVIVSSNHIRNGLNPTESVTSLLARLCDCANKDWALAYIESTGDLHVWPLDEDGKRPGFIKQVIKLYDGKGDPIMKNGEHLTRTREIYKKKFPMRPTDSNWARMVNVAKQSYVQYERSCGREATWNNLPTMRKGGVEFAAMPLQQLEIELNMNFLVPVGTGPERTDTEEVNRIIRELFIGIYVCHELPSLAMNPQEDGSVRVTMPPAYQGTLVGDVLKEVDALGKGVMQGIVFPEYARRDLMGAWVEGGLYDVLKGFVPSIGYEKTLKIYVEHGARVLNDASMRILEKTGLGLRSLMESLHIPTLNYTFIPRQKTLKQHGKNVLLDSELIVRGDFVLPDESERNREIVREAFNKSADGIGEILRSLPEAERPIRLLKIIGFMTQILVTLKKKGLCRN
jgi:hypothetical protein